MSTIIRRSALRSELQTQNRVLESIRERMQPLREAIDSYVNDPELLGSGFSAHKNYLSRGHIPALAELTNGITALINANSRHIYALDSRLQYEYYNERQIENELLYLDKQIGSWWFRNYEALGLNRNWTQAQRRRRTTVSRKRGRLRGYLTATDGLYNGLETIWGSVEVNLRRIENRTVCPDTGEFLLPSNEELENMILADILSGATGLSNTEILGVLNALGLAGTPLWCAFAADPVNMSTGNFIYTKEDIAIPGRYPLGFKRFYNSIGGTESVFGANWTHSYNIRLYDNASTVQIIYGDGHMESHRLNEDGSYTAPRESGSSLTKKEAYWELTSQTNETYRFDINGGMLKSVSGPNDKGKGLFDKSSATELSYDGGLLARVKNPCGSLYLKYDGNGRLKRITDHTGREAAYEYSGSLLSSVTHPTGAEHKYGYDESCNLTEITNALGIVSLRNEYDRHGRLIKQSYADGGVYSVGYDGNTTEATEQNGNVVKYERDESYRTVRTIYADSEERYEYNDQNKRTKHTDRNGNVRRYEYDELGNVTKVIDPLGHETAVEYNEHNKPTKITAPNGGVISNEYDDKGNMTAAVNPLGFAVRLENNKQGLVTEVTLPDGSTNSLEYDDRGNISTLVDALGNETKYEYDELNRAVRATDPMGNTTCFEYNVNGDISKATNADGKCQAYEYNKSGKLIKLTDFCGNETHYKYNTVGKLEEITDPSGGITRLDYDLMWNVAKQIDANGNETIFEYDKQNRLEKVTDAKGTQIRYEYDHNGNKTKVIGARGEETCLAYDALDRVKQVIEPDGAKSGVEYDSMGLITKIIDPMCYESVFEYDIAGQKINEKDPSGRELKYSYNALGQVSEVTDTIGRKTKYEYLPGGLLKSITYPDGRSEEYSYNANKNVASKKSQDGYTLNYEYDCLNQITRIYSSTGQEKTHTYDAVGNVTSITDANGNTTKYRYSPNGNLISVIDPLGNISEYDYDRLGNLIEARQLAELNEASSLNAQNSRLRFTRYERDELGQIKKITDALGNTEQYTYDESGNVLSKLDKDGFLTKYAYTPANQLEEVVYADGKSVRMLYNSLRQLTEIKDWLGITSIEVDELGRAKKITDHNGKEVEYTFGAEGERRSTKYPDGKIVEYVYDDSLRLKTLIDGENKIDYLYDSNSRLSEKIFSNGIGTNYSYNSMGMIFGLTHSDNDGVLDKYVYTYDNMVNKTGIEKIRRGLEEENGKYEYTYDALSRLTGVIKDGKQIKTFSYDEFGNRSHMTDQGGKTDYTYNALNQLISTVDTAGSEQSFSYDKRGNLIQILANREVKNTYEFGAINRLTKAANATGQVAGYDYNGLGFRVSKQISDSLSPTKHISYMLDLTKQYHNILQMSDDTRTQIFTWDSHVAFSDGNAYLHDELGSPLRYVDSMGSTIDSYGYGEFGDDLYGNQSIAQPFGYAGYMADSISGTYFAQAREYMPQNGRFTGEDSIKYGDNWYTYCSNNPLNFIDPLGLCEEALANVSASWNLYREIMPENWNHYQTWLRGIQSFPSLSNIQLLTNEGVRRIHGNGGRMPVEVLDLWSGVTFSISWDSPIGGYHTDWTPMTSADTAAIASILNQSGSNEVNWTASSNWDPRPGVINVNGNLIAVSYHLRPHGTLMNLANPGPPFRNPPEGNGDNGRAPSGGWTMGGHMCMYYGDSTNDNAPRYNEMAEEAQRLGEMLGRLY